MAEFVARGFDRAILGVDLDNPTGALALYEKLGFVILSRATEWMRDLELPAEVGR
jgi:ribosomal protein S18 acetylase RimI-like enzyme